MGRKLYEGVPTVKLFGEEIQVNCEVGLLPGKSGHADRDGIVQWLDGYEKKPKLVFVNHGENEVTDAFAAYLQAERGLNAFAPYSGTVFNLLTGEFEECPQGVPIRREERKTAKVEDLYQKLLRTAEKLMAVVRGSRGRPNGDLQKFILDLETLCKKWL